MNTHTIYHFTKKINAIGLVVNESPFRHTCSLENIDAVTVLKCDN